MSESSGLIASLVNSFARLDGDLRDANVPEVLRVGDGNEGGWGEWGPVRVITAREALGDVYRDMPGPFPPLFEELLLGYRWLEVDLRLLRLRPNPPGEGLGGFKESVLEDRGLTDYLLPRRLVPFGKGPGCNYDPICFDLSRTMPNGDCPIVQLDHEDILCKRGPVSSSLVAVSFEELVKVLVGLVD
jgi:hypothetical protein